MNFKKIFFVLFGILFVVIGILLMKHDKAQKARCTIETIGIVTNVNKSRSSSDNSYTYYPVIEYTANDKVISKESSIGNNPPKYSTGDQVTVLYNPEKVDEYIIKGDNSSKFIYIIFIALGSITAVSGVFAKVT